MSHLLSKPAPITADNNCTQHITPKKASWKYVGFEAYKLETGMVIEQSTEQQEVCLVILAGRANVTTKQEHWNDLGKRTSPFENEATYSVYIPPNDNFKVEATTELELAVCKAPAQGKFPARLIAPEDTTLDMRGVGSNQRCVSNILFDNVEAESLLVCEVRTPAGNWSSYPSHKHDRDAKPDETLLEETYYHRINPAQGFVVQRVYTDDRSLDETMTVEDGCVVMVPKGYHPVGVPHGYESYYLNVMAGPERLWIFHNDPDHEWIIEADKNK